MVSVTLALAGDTMLGRLVAERIDEVGPTGLIAPAVVERMRAADLCILNLECCISERGEPWPDPGKPFFFRAPPAAVETLIHLGVDAVTLANNHALDFGADALLDTLDLLEEADIAIVGAGRDRAAARRPALLTAGDVTMAVVGVTDHPADYAATPDRPGVAYADLRREVPTWLTGTVSALDGRADLTLVTPHWGPNMTAVPVAHVPRAATTLLAAGADLIAGHSAHVFHGVRFLDEPPRAVLYDLGDFIDDYAVHPDRRNDLGLLWTVTLDADGIQAIDALPLHLAFGATGPATGEDRAWIVERLRSACSLYGTAVEDDGDMLRLRAS